MDMNQVLAAELNVKPWQVEAAVKLIDEGNTIPFISRYRKEATGSLNDEILRNLYDRLMYLRSLNDRKAVVLASIEEQGKLTAELKKSIEEAATLVVVEDLYRRTVRNAGRVRRSQKKKDWSRWRISFFCR